MQRQTEFGGTLSGWRGRLLFGLLGVVWLVLSLTFAGMFLVVGTLAALVIGVRLAWMRRRLRQGMPTARRHVINGQYVVLDRHRHAGQGGADA